MTSARMASTSNSKLATWSRVSAPGWANAMVLSSGNSEIEYEIRAGRADAKADQFVRCRREFAGLARALEVAHKVAARSAFAAAQLKRVINQGLGAQLAGALELERAAAMACLANADTAQRAEAFAAQRLS